MLMERKAKVWEWIVGLSLYIFLFSSVLSFFPPPFLLGVEGSNVRQGLDREKLERNGANGPSYPNGEK